MGLAYERHGVGPPLILLHGIGHRRQAWYPVVGRLAPRREVVLVDLPGHGESPPLNTAGRSVAQALIDDVFTLLADLSLDRPHLAGNSVGGRIALEAAVRGRAASVTAFSPAGFWRSGRELAYARAVDRTMEAAGRLLRPLGPVLSRSTLGRALLYAEVVNRPSRVSPEQALGDLRAFVAARTSINSILAAAIPFFGAIPSEVPVTIAWGTRDRLLSPRQALVAKERLPYARLVPLPGCGHVPMTDDPQLVADVLLRGSRAESGLMGQLSDVSLAVALGACQVVSSGNRFRCTAGSGRGRDVRFCTCDTPRPKAIAVRVSWLTRCNMHWRCTYTPEASAACIPRLEGAAWPRPCT